MTQTTKSLALSAVLVLTLAAIIFALVRTGKVPGEPDPAPHDHQHHGHKHHDHKHHAAAPASAPPVASVKAVEGVGTPVQRRVSMARRMQQRLRNHGRKITMRAVGKDATTFEVLWQEAKDREHMSDLQQARPLHEELKGMGFVQLVMKLRGRELWSKKL